MKWWLSKRGTVRAEIRISHTLSPEDLVESVATFMDDVPHTKKAILKRMRSYLRIRGDEYWQCYSNVSDEKMQEAEDLCLKLKMLPPEYSPGFWQ